MLCYIILSDMILRHLVLSTHGLSRLAPGRLAFDGRFVLQYSSKGLPMDVGPGIWDLLEAIQVGTLEAAGAFPTGASD